MHGERRHARTRGGPPPLHEISSRSKASESTTDDDQVRDGVWNMCGEALTKGGPNVQLNILA